MRIRIWSLASLGGLGIQCWCECSVGCRWGLDLALLWLWVQASPWALIWPLAWELPYAARVALKRKNKQLSIFIRLNGSILSCLHKRNENVGPPTDLCMNVHSNFVRVKNLTVYQQVIAKPNSGTILYSKKENAFATWRRMTGSWKHAG